MKSRTILLSAALLMCAAQVQAAEGQPTGGVGTGTNNGAVNGNPTPSAAPNTTNNSTTNTNTGEPELRGKTTQPGATGTQGGAKLNVDGSTGTQSDTRSRKHKRRSHATGAAATQPSTASEPGHATEDLPKGVMKPEGTAADGASTPGTH